MLQRCQSSYLIVKITREIGFAVEFRFVLYTNWNVLYLYSSGMAVPSWILHFCRPMSRTVILIDSSGAAFKYLCYDVSHATTNSLPKSKWVERGNLRQTVMSQTDWLNWRCFCLHLLSFIISNFDHWNSVKWCYWISSSQNLHLTSE